MSGPYEIFFPPLGTSLRFRIMPAQNAYQFAVDNEDSSPDDFKVKVLHTFIHEFRTEVLPMISAEIEDSERQDVIDKLYRSCVSLNPAIDFGEWNILTNAQDMHIQSVGDQTKTVKTRKPRKPKQEAVSPADKYSRLGSTLRERVIGQEEAIEVVTSTMKREFAGLSDEVRPIGVFLFAGASGVGKTMMAETLHDFLVDGQYGIVKIDCGEFQHKHENQKLIGSPPGYHGSEEGGQLTNHLINNPRCVVLLDEIEKAHPDILNTFLNVFDKGVLTDGRGRKAFFNQAVIIMTTNLGNKAIFSEATAKGVGFGGQIYRSLADTARPGRESVIRNTEQAIKEHFTLEMLNRIDEVVVFNHLTDSDFAQIAENELVKLGEKLEKKGYRLVWDETVVPEFVKVASNPVYGARGISRLRRQKIEDPLAALLLEKTYVKGTTFQVVFEGDEFRVTTQKSTKRVS